MFGSDKSGGEREQGGTKRNRKGRVECVQQLCYIMTEVQSGKDRKKKRKGIRMMRQKCRVVRLRRARGPTLMVTSCKRIISLKFMDPRRKVAYAHKE